jgi:hypothetical protein
MSALKPNEENTMKRIQRDAIFLLAAAMASIHADAPAYRFKSLVSTGTNIGGHSLPQSIAIDGVALNDQGDIAWVARWDEYGRERTGVYTLKGLVAQDGDILDLKPLSRILPTSLSINEGGDVAFEANYGSQRFTGIFAGRKFGVQLSKSGASNDFILNDDGKLVLYAAVAAAPVPTAAATASQTVQRAGGVAALQSLESMIRHSPVPLPNPGILFPNTNAKKGQQPPKGQAPASHTCPVPEWPMPGVWIVGEEMAGPITSHTFEQGTKVKPYDSRFFGHIATPYRLVQFSADCKPLVIVLVDAAHPYYVEMWTPKGLLTHTNSQGLFEFNGYSPKVTSAQLIKGDTPLRINRHGVIAFPVNLEPDGFAILLATPTLGAH